MNLFPGISQIQSALLGMAVGAILAGIGGAVLTHKIDNARYDRLVAAQATAHSQALTHEAAAQTAFNTRLAAANGRAADLQHQLDLERQKHAGALRDAITSEGNKDAPLKQCLSRKLPADILRQLAH